MKTPGLEISKEVKKDSVVLTLTGGLDDSSQAGFLSTLEPLKQDDRLTTVVLDLEAVTHIDSRGLSTLLSLHRHFTERGANFRLVNVKDYVLHLFQVSNLVNLFEIGPEPTNEATLIHDQREALWRSHAFTTQLIAALGEAVLGIDAEGRVLFANPAAERLFGWDEADLLGRSLEEATHPETADGQPVLLSGRAGEGEGDSGAPVLHQEAVMTSQEGRLLHVEFVATTIYQSGERIGRVLGIRNLTERKREQEELRRLATVVEQAAEMILITDTEGTIQYVNPAFEKITGYTRGEVVGQSSRLLKSGKHDKAFYKNLWDTILRGEVWSGRFVNRRKDASLYEEEATISPVHDGAGKISNFVAVKRDITEEVHLQRQLYDSQKLEAIARLAGGVAHDFNNLLTTIVGNIQLALTRKSGDVKEFLEKAETACMRGASLVQQLLLYSRKSLSGSEPVNLNTLAHEVIDLARQTIDRRIEIEARLSKKIPIVRADPGQIHQVMLNLILNARDAIEDGLTPLSEEPSLSRILVESEVVSLEEESVGEEIERSAGNYVILSVTDSGPGIDSATQERLFEPFFTTKDIGRGTGLGLATAYGIVKTHGGWLEVSSQLNQGATFRVYLPAADSEEALAGSPEEEPELVGGSETLLIIDDEAPIRDLARTTLEEYGYRVWTAADGQQGLDLYTEHVKEVDLVVLDLSMPKLSGREVLARMRNLNPTVRIIISSGYLAGEVHDLRESACSAFVQKPYRIAQLVRQVREVLDRQVEDSKESV